MALDVLLRPEWPTPICIETGEEHVYDISGEIVWCRYCFRHLHVDEEASMYAAWAYLHIPRLDQLGGTRRDIVGELMRLN